MKRYLRSMEMRVSQHEWKSPPSPTSGLLAKLTYPRCLFVTRLMKWKIVSYWAATNHN